MERFISCRIFSRRVEGMSFVFDYSNLQATLKLKKALRFDCLSLCGFTIVICSKRASN